MRARTRNILGAAVMALPTSLFAQGLTVHTVNDVRFYGTLGTIMGVAERFGGGGMHDIAGTTYISGHKMRIDSGNNATIVDADEGRVTTIDNKNKTYTSMTFAEMADAMQKGIESAKAENSKAQQQGKRTDTKSAKDAKDPKGEMNVTYKMSVDKPGDREKIAGYNAERTFVTITIEGEAKPEDGSSPEKVGSLVLLIDNWMSKDAPQIKAQQEFQRAYAAKAGKAFTPPMESMKAAFNSDPRIKTGFEASAKELEKLQGVMLRGVTYVTLVPPNMTFDRNLALGQAAGAQKADAEKAEQPEEKKSGGFRGLAGRLKSAAEEASKKASTSDKKDEKADLKQTTIMTVKEETKDITVGSVSSDLFSPPAGYRDVTRRDK